MVKVSSEKSREHPKLGLLSKFNKSTLPRCLQRPAIHSFFFLFPGSVCQWQSESSVKQCFSFLVAITPALGDGWRMVYGGADR